MQDKVVIAKQEGEAALKSVVAKDNLMASHGIELFPLEMMTMINILFMIDHRRRLLLTFPSAAEGEGIWPVTSTA